MIAKLEASPLGRAVRRLDFQERERLEEEPPDDPDRHDIPATVAAGPMSPSPAVSATEKDSPAVAELRRDMNSVTTQLAHMSELMQLIIAQQQQLPQDAAALASPSAGSPTDDQQQNNTAQHTGSPTDDQQQNNTAQHRYNETYSQQQLQGDQQVQYEAWQPQTGDHQQSEQGTAGGRYEHRYSTGAENLQQYNQQQQHGSQQQQYEAGQPETGDHQQSGGTALSLQCPVSAMLTLQRFELHDSSLFSKATSRWTVDCVSFYDHINTNRSKVTTALEQAVLERGPLVVRAVSEFIEAVTPGNNPAAHSMAGTIICGFKSSGSKAVTGNLRGLCMNALYRSRDLEELIGEVRRNGIFNREVAAMKVKASDMAGFRDFDPATEQGRQRWVQLQELVVAFFGKSVSRQLSEDKARAVLDALRIQTVSEYIPEEQGAYEDFCDAGGDISEADRIKVTKQKFGVKLKKAYDSFVEMKAIENGPDELLEKRWGRFLTMLEKVGGAVGPEGRTSAALPAAAAAAALSSKAEESNKERV